MRCAILSLIASVAVCAVARGDDPKPSAVLQGRPDANVHVDDAGLAPAFESVAAGISVRPPAALTKAVHGMGGDDIVVRYVDESGKSFFKVTRLQLSKPAPLVTDRDAKGNVITGGNKLARQGILELSADQMKMDMGGVEILRQDTIKLADGDAGMIAARYQAGGDTFLTQRGIIQASDQLYFIVELCTPAPREGDISADPNVKQAVDLFGKVLDSIRLMDQSALKEEYRQRLYRTRAFFANLTEPRLRSTLVPQQWLRLVKDGKDIGYSYVVEEEAQDLPRTSSGVAAPVRGGGTNGVRVGVRSRTIRETTPPPAPDGKVPPGVREQVDGESWMWVSVDRKHEVWSSIVYALAGNARDRYGEFGSTDMQIRRVIDNALEPGETLKGGERDARQPPVREQDIYLLSVTPINIHGRNKPLRRELSPFYLPQALAHLLPRLVPRWEPKGYVFASYVSDDQNVVLRYVDVLREDEVTLAGQKVRAIPITDRLGYEGSVTTHYISPEGQYLGSVNEDTKVTVLPTDAPTLEKIWKDANLTRPGDVEASQQSPTSQPSAK